MGLDQYAYRTQVQLSKPVDFNDELQPQSDSAWLEEQIWHWCKHTKLHNWMEELYRQKGGQKESFNLVPVELTLADLAQLEEEIRQNFFSDESVGSDEEDFEFVRIARLAIEAGDRVFYDSWW
jgi:hypothetical protein